MSERRVEQDMIFAAFGQACPGTAGTTQGRPVLAALLDELSEHSLVDLPRGRDGWDDAQPPLPRWLRLAMLAKPDTRSAPAAAVVWRREISWAGEDRLTTAQLEVLKRINRWLRDTDGDEDRRTVVPMRERSFEIFGNEKRLDALTATALFAPHRLTLATLFTERIPPPLAYERLGDGDIILVIENSDTYETIRTLLIGDRRGQVGYIAFGGGHAFEASVARIAKLDGVTDIAYYGDLDNDGLTIPQRANISAAASGLPPVRPAHGLYRLLLQQDIRTPAPGQIEPIEAERRVSWLPETMRHGAADILVAGRRLAQEATGAILLRRDNSWRDDL